MPGRTYNRAGAKGGLGSRNTPGGVVEGKEFASRGGDGIGYMFVSYLVLLCLWV